MSDMKVPNLFAPGRQGFEGKADNAAKYKQKLLDQLRLDYIWQKQRRKAAERKGDSDMLGSIDSRLEELKGSTKNDLTGSLGLLWNKLTSVPNKE